MQSAPQPFFLYRSGCHLQARNDTLKTNYLYLQDMAIVRKNVLHPASRPGSKVKSPHRKGMQRELQRLARAGAAKRRQRIHRTGRQSPLTAHLGTSYDPIQHSASAFASPASTLWRAGTRRGTALHAACPPFLTLQSALSGYTVAWFMGILSSLGFFSVFCVTHLSDFVA